MSASLFGLADDMEAKMKLIAPLAVSARYSV
jgi:hypothetical protein